MRGHATTPTKAALEVKMELVQSDGDQGGYPLLLHGHAKKRIGNFHGALVVRNHDHLGMIGDILDQPVEKVGVGVIERRIHFIQNQEGGRPVHQDGKNERDGRKRLLSAG